MKKIAFVIFMISSIMICGCLGSNTSDHEEEEKIDHEEEKQNEPATYSIIMRPGSIHDYRSNYEITNITPVLHDDGKYLAVSGDCMTWGRGVVFSNFSELGNINETSKIINVTLVVDYKTDNDYNTQGYIQWSTGGIFSNTTIRPTRNTNDVTVGCILLEGNASLDDLKEIKVRYFNHQGGIDYVPIDFDVIYLNVCYQ